MQNNQSEVRALLQQIEQEYHSAQAALNDYAITSPHVFITTCLENMNRIHDNLQHIVGDDAIRLIVECIEALPD